MTSNDIDRKLILDTILESGIFIQTTDGVYNSFVSDYNLKADIEKLASDIERKINIDK